MQRLKELKIKRNALMHPKKLSDIIELTFNDFDTVKIASQDYIDFINKIMSNFFIEYTANDKHDILKKVDEALNN